MAKSKSINYTLPTKNIWFPDQVEPIYDPSDFIADYQFKEYWKREKDRMINGIELCGGLRISGWLYWHTVYWKIKVKARLPNGRVVPRIQTPTLRDIDWEADVNFERAYNDGKFIELVGARGFGKTVWQSSRAAWYYTLIPKSQVVVSAGNSADIKNVTDMIEQGLNMIHPMLKKKRLKNDWSKEIKAGFKEADGQESDKSSFSQIIMRNYKDGNVSMAINGTRPDFHIIDEIGKIKNFIKCVKDSDGCYWANQESAEAGDINKPTCLPMYTGCVCAGTKVWNSKGKLINIEDLKQEDGILGFDGEKISKEDITWIQPPSKKVCYRITTFGGNEIECSEDHPFLSSRRTLRTTKGSVNNILPFAYVEAQNLKKGDYLSLIDIVPLFGKEEVEEARLLGMLIGDGYCGEKSISMSIDDVALYEYVSSNFKIRTKKEFLTKEGIPFKEVSLSGVKKIVREAGILGLSKESKKFPSNIYEYNKASLSEFIAGYFDTDGNVNYHSKKNTTRVVLTSICLHLLEEMKYLLIKFGINSSIYKENRNRKYKISKGQKDYIYRLYISQDESVKRFRDNIPIIHTKKVRTLANFTKGNRDFGRNGNCVYKGESISGIRYEGISKIECIGEKDVYNLSAGNTHTYLANGCITHNTGGDMEVGADSAEIFFKPDSYNVLAFEDKWEGRGKIGWFMPIEKSRNEYKEPISLSKYLGIEDERLDKITILVSNEDRCIKEWWEPKYAEAVKSGNPTTVLSFKAYWPRVPSDSFLVLTQNDYNVEACKVQQTKLKIANITGTFIELFHDGERICHKLSDLLPLSEWPAKRIDKDAPIIIYEFPPEDPPFGLYVAGIDPYRFSQAEYSESVGAVYIFKRVHDILSEKYQYMFVASYSARPLDKKKWNEQARFLIKYYNARALCENDEYSFIDYMIAQGDGHYLEDEPEWIKELVPNTKVNRKKGIHRSAPQIREYLDGVYGQYLDEVINRTLALDGSVEKEVLGVSKILDMMLLEETIRYNKKEGNFDRVVAAQLALALAKRLDPIIKVSTLGNDTRYKSYMKRKARASSVIQRDRAIKSSGVAMNKKRKSKLFL